jgi:hypothetical protein
MKNIFKMKNTIKMRSNNKMKNTLKMKNTIKMKTTLKMKNTTKMNTFVIKVLEQRFSTWGMRTPGEYPSKYHRLLIAASFLGRKGGHCTQV